MGKGMGIGALVLAVLAIFIPVYGPWLTVIVAIMAVFIKSPEFGLATGAIIINFINLIFLSPTTWLFLNVPDSTFIPLIWLGAQAVGLFVLLKNNGKIMTAGPKPVDSLENTKNVIVTKKNMLIFGGLLVGLFVLSSIFSSDPEALKVADQYFSKRVLKCGNKHYVRGYTITELEGLDYYVTSSNISEIDRKNGVEWKGSVGFKARTYRPLNGKNWGEYGKWDTGFGVGPNGISGYSISIVKKNGKWHGIEEEPYKNDKSIGGALASSINEHFSLKKVDFTCTDLPKQ